ncbi:peptide ABC transporter substrate-binding protein [Bacillus cihuensis]|uniref:peptide ABC transporter substrate-binding protein n=1 Tax=Bacillus cihuensis TaxID=1208599 RepID=UPI00040ABA05|nr:peptide ABC transporter substrate-binding protein [Bacillus cihuensis]
MKRNKFSFFALVIGLMVVISGCNSFGETEKTSTKDSGKSDGKKEAVEKVLNLNNSSEPGSLHPGTAEGTHDSWILEHAFEGLTKKTPEGEIVDGMASVPTSEDGINWIFKIKEGMKWSNGDPVTAHDFEFAWKYALAPETASEYAYQLFYLEGAEAYNAGTGTVDQVGVKAKDDTTLEVKLAQATPYFLDLTSFYTYYPVNKKVQEENPKWFTEATSYVSNGPFKLTEWKHKESVKLEKNENYYEKDKINLDVVNFVILEDENTAWQMYQSGELDLSYPLPQDVQGQLAQSNNKEFHNGPDLAVYYYNLNNDVKPFNNIKVRKALSLAIDRKTITENVAQGGQQSAYSVVPPGIPDVNGDYQENTGNLFTEDVEEAKKLLAEGLAEEGMDKLPEFSILYNTLAGHQKIAEAVQEMWRKNLGVTVTLENTEFQVKLDREKAGKYQVSRAGWVGDYVDPMTFMDLWTSDNPHNDANWKNAEYDQLIKEAKQTMDQQVRMDNMHKAEKLLMAEMPIIPIYFYTKPHMVKEYVTGVYTPINRYPQFIYADVDMDAKE